MSHTFFLPLCCRVRRRRDEKNKSSWLRRDERRSRSRSPARNDRHRESHRSESHRHASSSHRRDEHRSTREEKDREPVSQLDKEEMAKQRREKEIAELDDEVTRRRRRIETWQVPIRVLVYCLQCCWLSIESACAVSAPQSSFISNPSCSPYLGAPRGLALLRGMAT